MERLSLAHRIWRRLPPNARRAGLGMMARALAPVADKVPPDKSQGLAVAGELSRASGVGEAARLLAGAAAKLGYGGVEIDLGIGRRPRGTMAGDAALLMVVNAPSIPLMLARAGRDFLRTRRVIGAWAWELPVVPSIWRQGGRYVHEVWAGSPFIAAALEPLLPGRVRMVPNPLGLRGVAPAMPDRAAFGLPQDAVVTCMVLSLGSSFSRKNPLAGIAAFKRAFGDRRDQMLVVKLSGGAADPRAAACITAEAAHNILIFNETWSRAQVDALLESSDIVLSLHRSEGFGLVPAEAMLRGKPVVATGWSGNMAFMDETSAALVGYELVPVADESGLYGHLPDVRWAEPDIGHAAEWLRRLGDDAALRARLGARGQAFAARALNGDEMRESLAANGILPVADLI